MRSPRRLSGLPASDGAAHSSGTELCGRRPVAHHVSHRIRALEHVELNTDGLGLSSLPLEVAR